MQDKKRRIRELRKKVDAPRLVGDCEDVLPFAWRTPPEYDGKCSKVVQEMLQSEELRKNPPPQKK